VVDVRDDRDVSEREWSTEAVIDRHDALTTFNGRFSNAGVELRLPAPPPPEGADQPGDQNNQGGDNHGGGGGGGGEPPYNLFTLWFDLYLVDSWDGENPRNGPDRLEVLANGESVFRETFTNDEGLWQSFRGPDDGPRHIGFRDLWKDSIYRDIDVSFTIDESDTQLVIRWQDLGLQGMSDESWAIDNVRVAYTAVPAPGSMALAACGGFLLLRRRR
jgi:hypothetical protein